ncbi:MAG: hydrogenase maturation protease [Anaerolineales bacterium]|nr:hydrogenase maturation protease [Anaerolineales bacterium]
MRKLIAGLGNPILGDDGVGWRVAEEVSRQTGTPLGDSQLPSQTTPEPDSVSIERFALSGIALMERMVGYEQVILIDSLNTGKYEQGKVVVFTLDSLADLIYGHTSSAHDVSLKNALVLGRQMGASLPADENVFVVAIEAEHVYDFKEYLSPAIAASVHVAVDHVIKLLEK